MKKEEEEEAFIARVGPEKTTEYKEQFYSFHTSIGFVMI